ncbi:unnamed protein product [Rotaria sordida]|uniref:Uncharacterized protein n=1 Tax=Rotaria sordida TaxID=392033 RepID=A0A814QY38_9BILA|nr:unnamed protein product [Rotaria sordida]
MLAINTSVAKSTNKTPFQVVFGQHPCTEDDILKTIFNRQQQGGISTMILEEDLSDDIASISREVDEDESRSTSVQGDDKTEQLNTNEKMIHNEDQEEDNDKDDIQQDIVIDHEECVDETELPQNKANLNINLNS